MSRICIQFLACLLLSLLLPSRITAAVLSLPSLISNNAASGSLINSTLVASSELNGTKPPAARRRCATPTKWWNSDFDPDHCKSAVDYFSWMEMGEPCGARPCEFRAPGAKKQTYQKMQWTPRKCNFWTCTIGIVMVDYFADKPGELPGGGEFGPPTDTSTYRSLYTVAQGLVTNCVIAKGELGWQLAGNNLGIGVFVWATDSEMDLEIGVIDFRPPLNMSRFIASE